MNSTAIILGNPAVRLWGLTSRERLVRQIEQVGGMVLGDGLAPDVEGSDVLLLSADYLFEIKTIKGLMGRTGVVLVDDQGIAAAAFVRPGDARQAAAWLRQEIDGQPSALERLTASDLGSFDEELRRSDPPLLERIETAHKDRLESLLYGNAYRGITDLVTKFFWPRPARVMVHWCASLGITPNAVTSVGLFLVIAASWLFLQGEYVMGLLAGWVMTFLDTVDGKLARVTVRSSKVGHVLDHGMDILHPPFWYVFWGMSLPSFSPFLGIGQAEAYWWVVAAYVLGRVVEGVFPVLGDCTIFTWRPFDAWFRLVTARRNPCLIILTVATAAGRPDIGFAGVVLWSIFTTAVLILRLALGLGSRMGSGPLSSWMADRDAAAERYPTSFRLFAATRSAYGGA